jgi:hypothetical protein
MRKIGRGLSAGWERRRRGWRMKKRRPHLSRVGRRGFEVDAWERRWRDLSWRRLSGPGGR